MHDAVTKLVHDLNFLYQKEKTMYFEEHNPAHFRWLMVDNADQSVFAFERCVDDDVLVFVYNMTPNFYESYTIPMLHDGTFEEIFNSDKKDYGGDDQYNGLPLVTGPGSFEGLPHHLTFKLGSFTACIFKKIDPSKNHL